MSLFIASDSEESMLGDLFKTNEEDQQQKQNENDSENDVKTESDSDSSSPPVKRPRKKNWNKEQQIEREKQLTNLIFGNKTQFLDNLKDTADGGKSTDVVSAKREAVWHDSGDEELEADDVINSNKKAAPFVRKIGKYNQILEKKFQNILGTPAWADLDRTVDPDSDDEILQTVGHVVKKASGTKLLHNKLQYKRLKDLNRATYAEGPGITSVQFHPTSSVAIVTGRSGMAGIYSIDGLKNDKLHSVAFKNYAIKCCRLNRSGMEAIIGGSKKFFYTYNLMSGDTQRVFLPKAITKMCNFELSPCGKFISVVGRFGDIHILDAQSKELLWTLKQENEATALSFSIDSQKLFAHSCDAEISVFDLRLNRQQHRFIDEGCINGTTLDISPNGQLLASGSRQGVVNVYDIEKVLQSATPIPQKTIFNLTTSIAATKFNHSSELLAICSGEIDDAVKIVHFPSATVYSNFPDFQAKIGKPHVLAFSPQSGYLAIGNAYKEVPLFRLKHFNNY